MRITALDGQEIQSEYLLKVYVDQFGCLITQQQRVSESFLRVCMGLLESQLLYFNFWAISQLRLYLLVHFSEISKDPSTISLKHFISQLTVKIWSTTGPLVSLTPYFLR